MTTSSAWSLLLLASVFEIAFALSMKFTGGFTRLGPSLVTIVLAGASVVLLSRALTALPVGTAYAAWTGIGAVGTATLGIVLFGEPVSVGRLASIGCVILGVVGLRFLSAEPASSEARLEGTPSTTSVSSTIEDSPMSSGRPILLSPVRVGGLLLPSRVVMAPMTRNRATSDGVPTPLMAEYYTQRASAGLIVTEATQVSPEGAGYPRTPGIHTDAQVAGWRRVTDAVHARGGRILLQLWHVGRISHPSLQPGGALPVAPSAIAPSGTMYHENGPLAYVTPRALTTEEIAALVERYRVGAERAKAVGFDGVEIHAAHGFLMDQFLQDVSNQRTDRYGGSPANRARFLLEVVEAVIGVWGSDRVGVRISPLNRFNSMGDSDPQATFGYLARALNALAPAYLHVVELIRPGALGGPTDHPITPSLREAFRGTLIANGGYARETAEAALASGLADLVSFAEPFIANPDLVERFAMGAPLAAGDKATYHGIGPAGDAQGYTDYPRYEREGAAA